MIAEIAAANAAFQVIKGALTNGKELYDVAEQATKYFDNKSAIAKKANRTGGSTELQCFMQLEKIKEQEEWLKEHMIYAGRADMYGDWLKFQADCKQKRERAERIRKQKRAANLAVLWSALLWGTGGLVLLPFVLYVAFKLFGVI
jgi:molecular chaperone GrpE (heat shock protein)